MARAWLAIFLLLVGGLGSVAAGGADEAAAPHNVILLISDGAGFAHFEAASLYATGAPRSQACWDFPVRLAMSTHSAGGGVTDSAASITAMACGVKTTNGTLGLDAEGTSHPTFAEHMEARGMATGVVTSVPFSHATPAGIVAHVSSRNAYGRIAEQMLFESGLDVIMGAGHPLYDHGGRARESEVRATYFGDAERWARVLDPSSGWTVLHSRPALRALAQGPTPPRVLGLPRVAATLQQRRPGDPGAAPFAVPGVPDVPTLAEMTAAALNVLDDDPDGFFLLVEGGAVDWAGHRNQLGRMIEEQLDFDAATDVVLRWVEANDAADATLVIVTSDHECGDLTDVEGRGAGRLPRGRWNSKKHTNRLVPFFAVGRGSDAFAAQGGRTLDNTDVGRILRSWFAPAE